MEQETNLLIAMLSDLQQLDIILHNDNHIDAGIVSQEL